MTTKKKQPRTATHSLRQRAEAMLSEDTADISAMRPEEIQSLVHELQVHQIELRMQNEELRAAQYELADARDRYFGLYELAPFGYLTLDQQGHIQNANLTAARIFGRERSALFGTRIESLLAPEDRDECYLRLRQVDETDTLRASELRLDSHEGAADWILLDAVLVNAPQRGEREWRVTLRDITRRKNAEAALRESQARMGWVLEQTGVGMWLNPLPFGRLTWDEQIRRLFYVSPHEETTIDLFWSRVHPDDRERTRLAIESAIRDHGLCDVEFRIVAPDASEIRWVRSVGRAGYAPDGTPTRFDGISYDVTQRKRAQEALQREAQILAQVHDAVVTTDLEGNITLWNKGARRLVGYTADEALGRHVSLLYPEEDLPGVVDELIRRVLAEGEHQTIVRCRTKLGELLSVHLSLSVLRDERAAPYGLIGYALDVTERTRLEDERRRLNETLERRVAERTEMLALLNDVASAANEAGDFEEVLEYTLRRVSEHNGWCFGHAYLLEKGDPAVLVTLRTYYESAPGRYRRFQAATRRLRLRPGQGLPGRTLAAGAVQWADDITDELVARRAIVGRELGLCCGAAFPILAGEDVVGALEFFADRKIEPSDSLVESMTSVGTQLGRVVERRRFEKELARAVLAEQRRLGQDLHDTVSQEMAGLALIAERMAQDVRAGTPLDAARLTELAAGLRHALSEARAIVRGLLPTAVMHADDLRAALLDLATTASQRHNVACELDCPRAVAIDAPDVALHLYRIAAEAVTNAIKHAQAREIMLSLAIENGKAVLEVRDDGVGFREEDAPRGSGLSIMRHRANVIDGTFEIRRGADGGTVVTCALPEDRLHWPGREEA